MLRKIQAAICIISVFTLLTAGCGQSGTASESAEAPGNSNNPAAEEAALPADDSSYKIDVILKTTSSEYWSYVAEGIESYKEVNPHVQIDIKGASSETAFDEQKKILEEDLSSDSYDAYIIAPLENVQTKEAVAGTEKPVIALDTEFDAPEVLSYVGTSNEDAAWLGGTAAVKAAAEKGWEEINAVCISGVKGDKTAEARLDGYEAGIVSEGGTFLRDETCYGDAEGTKAASAMEEIMKAHPEGIAIICANNDEMAIAAAKAAAGNEAYSNTVFVGFDGIRSACEAIKEGTETISVAQDAADMGFRAVETAVKALDGEAVDPVIYSNHMVIDKSNVDERLKSLAG